MAEQSFLSSLKGLAGKVAIVTGGGQGIGLQTTILLALLGADVYVCALNDPRNHEGILSALEYLKVCPTTSPKGSIRFHELDLSSVKSARRSAEIFKSAFPERLDIVIGNAGIAFPPLSDLSPDGVEKTFAVNCLGHFVFINSLIDQIKKTARSFGQARITLTSSYAYKTAAKLDYTALTTKVPDDGEHWADLAGGYQRYADSKLAVLYYGFELDRRLRERGVQDVFVNVVHPGNVPTTAIGNDQNPLVGPLMSKTIKSFLAIFMRHSPQDAAKTQVLVSAGKETCKPNDTRGGEFWAPLWTWGQRYNGSATEDLATSLAKDEQEWKKLWEFCEDRAGDSPRTSEAQTTAPEPETDSCRSVPPSNPAKS